MSKKFKIVKCKACLKEFKYKHRSGKIREYCDTCSEKRKKEQIATRRERYEKKRNRPPSVRQSKTSSESGWDGTSNKNLPTRDKKPNQKTP